MNPALGKTVLAGLKAVPFFGDGVAVAHTLSSPAWKGSFAKLFRDSDWKLLQAGAGIASSTVILGGFMAAGFHHPHAARIAWEAGGGVRPLIAASEFAPDKMKAAVLRALSVAADRFVGPPRPLPQGFSIGRGPR